MFSDIIPDWSYITFWITAALFLVVMLCAIIKMIDTDRRRLRGKDISYALYAFLAPLTFLSAVSLAGVGAVLMFLQHDQVRDTAIDHLHDTYDAEVRELPGNPLHTVINGDPVPVSVYVDETVYTDTYGALYRDHVDDIELVYLDEGDQVAPAPSDLTTTN